MKDYIMKKLKILLVAATVVSSSMVLANAELEPSINNSAEVNQPSDLQAAKHYLPVSSQNGLTENDFFEYK
jgi:hypothetical protein